MPRTTNASRHWSRLAVAVALAIWAGRECEGQTVFPGQDWREPTPQSQGVESTKLKAAVALTGGNCPSEEPQEREGATPPKLVSIVGETAILENESGQKEVGVDSTIANWRLVAVIPDNGAMAVMERDFNQWGMIVYATTSGAVATIRKSVGRLDKMGEPLPSYPKDYFDKVLASQVDVLGKQVFAKGGDPSYPKVVGALAPLKTYTFVSTTTSKEKLIVFQDGRIGTLSEKVWLKDLES